MNANVRYDTRRHGHTGIRLAINTGDVPLLLFAADNSGSTQVSL
jgi:hypothetical protein